MIRIVMTVMALGCALACSSTRAKEDRENARAQLERIRDRTNPGVPPGTNEENAPIDKAVERAKEEHNEPK